MRSVDCFGRTMSCTLLFSLVLILSSIDSPGDTVAWANLFGGPAQDEARFVKETSDGGCVLAGQTNSFGDGLLDVWVLKLDKHGEIVWEYAYGGNDYDYATCIDSTADGGFVVAGFTNSFRGTPTDMWILKLGPDGNSVWEKAYGDGSFDCARFIQQTPDGGYIVAGYGSLDGCSWNNCWLLKLDETGNILWHTMIGGLGDSDSNSVCQTQDGGYAVAGYTTSNSTINYEILVARVDDSGGIMWQKTYGGEEADIPDSIIQTTDGKYLVAGKTKSFGNGQGELWLLKLDESGDVIWEKTYGNTGFDNKNMIRQTADGKYMLSGIAVENGEASRIWVTKLEEDGAIIWQRTFGEAPNYAGGYIQQTSDGGYLMAGNVYSLIAYSDVWAMKLTGDGEIPSCSLMGDAALVSAKTSSTSAVATRECHSDILHVRDTNATVTPTHCAVIHNCYIECPSIVLNPPYLANGAVGIPYSNSLYAAGGMSPHTFSLISGNLPTGIDLTPSGLLSGTPGNPGTHEFTVKAKDASGCSGTRSYSISIGDCSQLAMLPAELSNCIQGTYYEAVISVQGGFPPYTFSLTSGELPSGLDLMADGILSGTASVTGIFNFSFSASDSAGCAVSKEYVLKVLPPPSVTSMIKSGNPFRIKIMGANLQSGMEVYIENQLWTDTAWKNDTKLVLRGGKGLKTAVPKNTPRAFRIVNPDGGEVSVTWQWP